MEDPVTVVMWSCGKRPGQPREIGKHLEVPARIHRKGGANSFHNSSQKVQQDNSNACQSTVSGIEAPQW